MCHIQYYICVTFISTTLQQLLGIFTCGHQEQRKKNHVKANPKRKEMTCVIFAKLIDVDQICERYNGMQVNSLLFWYE